MEWLYINLSIIPVENQTNFFFRGHIKTFKYAEIYNIMQMGASQPSTTIME